MRTVLYRLPQKRHPARNSPPNSPLKKLNLASTSSPPHIRLHALILVFPSIHHCLHFLRPPGKLLSVGIRLIEFLIHLLRPRIDLALLLVQSRIRFMICDFCSGVRLSKSSSYEARGSYLRLELDFERVYIGWRHVFLKGKYRLFSF